MVGTPWLPVEFSSRVLCRCASTRMRLGTRAGRHGDQILHPRLDTIALPTQFRYHGAARCVPRARAGRRRLGLPARLDSVWSMRASTACRSASITSKVRAAPGPDHLRTGFADAQWPDGREPPRGAPQSSPHESASFDARRALGPIAKSASGQAPVLAAWKALSLDVRLVD